MAEFVLTADEKIAGRAFKSSQQAKLDALMRRDPPTFDQVLYNHANLRHECPVSTGNKSIAMKLDEVYVFSPTMVVVSEQDDRRIALAPQHPEAVQTHPNNRWANPVLIAEGRFGFIYREGKCRCGKTARSPVGQFVDAWNRPPLKGRVSR